MRLHLSLTPNTEPVPFSYQDYLIGVFHKWIGHNNIHDEISLYSLSWLSGGKAKKGMLDFPSGAGWFISFWDENLAKKMIDGAMKDPEICFGMALSEVTVQNTPEFSGKERFILASPVFIRRYDENKKAVHLTFKYEEADEYLTATLIKKLKTAGLSYDVRVRFDPHYRNAKTKLVKINNILNRASYCPVFVEGHPEAVKFAWNVGIGHSTGCGFGAVN